MTMLDVSPDPAAPPGREGRGRPQRVLIAPSYGNPESRARFADTLAREVEFTAPHLRNRLSTDELEMLLSLHPSGSARFWGAVARFDRYFDQLATGDVVLFTGQKRVQAVGKIGCKLRNQTLADELWKPDPDRGSWSNVYSVLDFQRHSDLTYSDIQQAAGYSPDDNFQGTRVPWTPEQSAAIIARLRLREAARSDEETAAQHGERPANGPVSRSAGPVRLDWTREEDILAMDFYVTCGAVSGQSIPGQDSSEIAQLSRLLKTLSAYPPEVQGEKYRNPQGVYLKLMNLRAVQTDGAHGMNAYSQLDAAVWRDYIDNLPGLQAEAAAIRQRLEDGTLTVASTAGPAIEDVDIEQQHTERFMVSPSAEPREAERAEQKLVLRYRDYMAAKGVTIGRKRYRPDGQVRPIYCDVWIEDRQALIEAKNSDGRDALRQAIGQLYDYRRFHEPPILLAVLLPYRPNPDGLALLHSAGIEVVWPHGDGFRDSAKGVFV